MYWQEGEMTPRQREVMGPLALGLSNGEMAEGIGAFNRKRIEDDLDRRPMLAGTKD